MRLHQILKLLCLFFVSIILCSISVKAGYVIKKILPSTYDTPCQYLISEKYCYKITEDSIVIVNLNNNHEQVFENQMLSSEIGNCFISGDSIYSLEIKKRIPHGSTPIELQNDTVIIKIFSNKWIPTQAIIMKNYIQKTELFDVNGSLGLFISCASSMLQDSIYLYTLNNATLKEYKKYSTDRLYFSELNPNTLAFTPNYLYFLKGFNNPELKRLNLVTGIIDAPYIKNNFSINYNAFLKKHDKMYVVDKYDMFESKDYGETWNALKFIYRVFLYNINSKKEILYATSDPDIFCNAVYLQTADTIEKISINQTSDINELHECLKIIEINDKFYIQLEIGLFAIENGTNSVKNESEPELDYDKLIKVELYDLAGKLINTIYEPKNLCSISQSLSNAYYCIFYNKDGSSFLKPYYFNR